MAIQPLNQRPAAQYSAEHYRQHRQQLAENGTVKKSHADSTKENIWGVMKKWIRHCDFLGEDRLRFLVRATKEDIMTFLKWVLDVYSRIKKRSTVDEYWRVWCMLYRKSVGKSLHAKVMEEVRDYIDGYLTIEYNLDTSVREKPVMNIDDVYLILHHLWVLDTSVFPDERQRLQLAFLILLSAYTATRPAALVYKVTDRVKQREHYLGWEKDKHNENDEMELDWEDIKTLCYEDVTLLVLPNPEGKRDLLAMEVTLKYTKGWKKRPNPKTYILTEVDTLVFDVILLMITIAILDNAFESKVTSMEEILRIRVRPPRRSLEFKWRAEMMKKPIFRQAERTPTSIQTSPTKALRYHTYLYYLQRLGLEAGFMQILGAYVIRRGAGEAVEAVATQPQLQQVMCHRDAGIYQAYINQRVQCDVQAAFLGQPSARALFKAVTHMSRYADPRAPTGLASDEIDALKADPAIVQLRELRDRLTSEARRESGTLKKAEAEGTKLYQMYQKADRALRSAKMVTINSAKKAARQQFFDTISTTEINKQLDLSMLDLQAGDWVPEKVEHRLEERRMVAALICQDTGEFSDQDKISHRIGTANALVALCQKKDIPLRLRPDRPRGLQNKTESPDHQPFPQAPTTTQCVFCFWNTREPYEVRLHNFSTVYKTRDHVDLHLKQYDAKDDIPCLDPECQASAVILHGHMHFKNHEARVHNYDIFRKDS